MQHGRFNSHYIIKKEATTPKCLCSRQNVNLAKPNQTGREFPNLLHRVDSCIESSMREIIGSKNFALVNFNLNFCETTIYYDNKVFIENLVAVH